MSQNSYYLSLLEDGHQYVHAVLTTHIHEVCKYPFKQSYNRAYLLNKSITRQSLLAKSRFICDSVKTNWAWGFLLPPILLNLISFLDVMEFYGFYQNFDLLGKDQGLLDFFVDLKGHFVFN